MNTLARLIRAAAGPMALAAVAACGSSTGPAASRNNPGTGTLTLNVTADVDANDAPGTPSGFAADFTVSVRNAAGSAVSGATVTITNATLGTITLVETPAGSGDYFNTRNSFPSGDFQLSVVKGADNVQGVVLGGPGVHTITAPVANSTVPKLVPLTVRWSVPSQALSAQVETRDLNPVTVPDTGAYVIPGPSNPARADQRIRVFRFNEVNMNGGLPGSRLRVTVRNTVEPIIVQ